MDIEGIGGDGVCCYFADDGKIFIDVSSPYGVAIIKSTNNDICVIDGNVSIMEGVTMKNLVMITGNVNIRKGADLPSLMAIKGRATISKKANLPSLVIIDKGCVYI